jgi:hypothetical protein
MAGHNTVLFASFDTTQFDDPESGFINYDNDSAFAILNNVPSTINFTISARDVSAITPTINFTSNGVDGFGDAINTFNIPKINFTNQKIFFIARFKDGIIPFKRESLIESSLDFLITQNDDTLRLFNTNSNSLVINEGDLALSLITNFNTPQSGVVSEEYAKFQSNFKDVSGTGGGFFKGYFTSTLTGTDFRIRLIYNSSTFNQAFTAFSTPFDISLNTGVYHARKANEDNNQSQNYKDLIYQDALLNKPAFFNNLLGQSVGGKDSSAETLGIKAFEKTANFVSNNTDPDYCNLKALISMFNSLDIDFEDYNQQFPPSLTRLVDILSVSPSRQQINSNQFQLNFDDRGYTSKTIFGKNKAEYLPVETTILKTGEESKYILAYEKFSENYTLVNTNLLSAVNVDYRTPGTYALSSYNESWGWGLIMPPETTGIDVLDYYEFYDYNNTIDGTIISDFIDYANSNCTYLQTVTSYGEIMDKDGVADNMLQHNLYTNCGLISGLEYVD